MRTLERVFAEKLGEKEAVKFMKYLGEFNASNQNNNTNNNNNGCNNGGNNGTHNTTEYETKLWQKNNLQKEVIEYLKKMGVVTTGDMDDVKFFLKEMIGTRFAFVDDEDI